MADWMYEPIILPGEGAISITNGEELYRSKKVYDLKNSLEELL